MCELALFEEITTIAGGVRDAFLLGGEMRSAGASRSENRRHRSAGSHSRNRMLSALRFSNAEVAFCGSFYILVV